MIKNIWPQITVMPIHTGLLTPHHLCVGEVWSVIYRGNWTLPPQLLQNDERFPGIIPCQQGLCHMLQLVESVLHFVTFCFYRYVNFSTSAKKCIKCAWNVCMGMQLCVSLNSLAKKINKQNIKKKKEITHTDFCTAVITYDSYWE